VQDLRLIAGRYLRVRRAAWVACLCIALAVAAMIVITSVMDGFRVRLHRHIRGTEPDLSFRLRGALPPDHEARLLASLSGLRARDGGPLLALAPRLRTVGLILATEDGGGARGTTFTTHGVEILGIDWERERLVVPLDRLLAEVQDSRLRASRPPDGDPLGGPVPGILIGRALADVLGIRRVEAAGFRSPDSCNLLTGRVVARTTGETAFEPSNLIFRVVGCFESGRDDYDLTHVFISRESFRLLRYGDDPREPDCSSVHARSQASTDRDLEALAARLQSLLPDLEVRTWLDENRALVDALRIEKATMTVILAFIVLLATALVLGLLVTMVVEKVRDIGILRSLGMGPGRLLLAFGIYGGVLGALGAGAGTVLGVLLVCRLNPLVDALGRHLGIEIFSRDVAYKFREIPAVLDAGQVLGIGLLAWGLAGLAALVVAVSAARVDPVQALQKE
jgi:lipoprotein-releasing system permease protein